jgi:hypothetical protein
MILKSATYHFHREQAFAEAPKIVDNKVEGPRK